MPEPDKNLTPGQEHDPLASYLAGVRERWDTAENFRNADYATALEHLGKALRSAADVPRLLGALEAVLNLVKPGPGEDCDLDGNPEGWVVRVIRCDEIRDAITKALTGEARTGG